MKKVSGGLRTLFRGPSKVHGVPKDRQMKSRRLRVSQTDQIVTDITAERNIEEELRSLRESMAVRLEQTEVKHRAQIRRFRHDLTDHVGAIIGFLKLLRDGSRGELDPRQIRCIENMDLSATNLLKVVERMAEETAPQSQDQMTHA